MQVFLASTCFLVKSLWFYRNTGSCDVQIKKTATFVNDEGKTITELPADFLGMKEGDDCELLRGDLSRILNEATRNIHIAKEY